MYLSTGTCVQLYGKSVGAGGLGAWIFLQFSGAFPPSSFGVSLPREPGQGGVLDKAHQGACMHGAVVRILPCGSMCKSREGTTYIMTSARHHDWGVNLRGLPPLCTRACIAVSAFLGFLQLQCVLLFPFPRQLWLDTPPNLPEFKKK